MLNWIKVLGRRFRGFVSRCRLDEEFRQELDTHLEMLAEENLRRGLPPDEARRTARMQLGGVTQLREIHREQWTFLFLETLAQDIRNGLRQLRRNPGFTIVAIITLALGIGANTAIFTVVNAVLLEPLPYRNPSHLVYISEFWPHERPVHAVPTPDFANWEAHNHVFETLAAYGGDRSVDVTCNGGPETVEGINVSTDFFSVLGVRPSLGRTFLAQEEQPGGRHAVLLAHAIWQQRFGSDTKILGTPITLDDREYTVVGILPAGFRFPDNNYDPQLFFPDFAASAASWHSKYLALQSVIGRLRLGITQAEATAQLGTIVHRTAAQEPPEFARMRGGMQIRMVPLHERFSGSARPLLLVLLGAAGLLLLIACVNVACLEFARAAGRQKEISVRAALGAGKTRLVRQLVTEGVMLAVCGGMAALVVGFWGVRLLRNLRPQQIPHLETIGMNITVFAFTFAVAVVTGVLFGLVPALVTSKVNLVGTLKEGISSSSGARGRRSARGALVASEIALAGVLLAGAGLLTRTFVHLINVDPGCRTHHLLTLRIALLRSRYSNSAQQTAFFQELLRQVRALAGVKSAAVGSGIPVVGWGYLAGTAVEGKPLPPRGSRPDVPHDWVSLDYFRTFGIPVIQGRSFDAADGQSAPAVAVVNQAFARQFFPGQNAVGKHVYTGSWQEIVGIVGDVRQNGPIHPAKPEVYSPYIQDSTGASRMVLVVRTMAGPLAVVPEIRRSVAAIDKSRPVYDVATMDERISKSIAPERFNMLLVSFLSGLALVLVSVGIYGVVAYSMTQRTHEFGIRMALGAERNDVLRMVVGQGLKLALAGVAIGIAGALVLTRFLSSLLYGVKPTDPLTFIAVSLILIAVALVACYIPARRAAKVDPMVALRNE